MDGGFEICQVNPDGSVEHDTRIFPTAEDALDMSNFSKPKNKIPNTKYTEKQLITVMAVKFTLGVITGFAVAAMFYQ